LPATVGALPEAGLSRRAAGVPQDRRRRRLHRQVERVSPRAPASRASGVGAGLPGEPHGRLAPPVHATVRSGPQVVSALPEERVAAAGRAPGSHPEAEAVLGVREGELVEAWRPVRGRARKRGALVPGCPPLVVSHVVVAPGCAGHWCSVSAQASFAFRKKAPVTCSETGVSSQVGSTTFHLAPTSVLRRIW
jgi:hypothetical protein